MKVLMLDLDGVANSLNYIVKRREQHFDDLDPIDPDAIVRLNGVIARTGAKVVISSTWRKLYDLEQLRNILAQHGFIGEVIDVTPSGDVYKNGLYTSRERGHEIQAWLDAHPEVTKFAIVDDNSDMVHLMPFLVQTTWEHGILDEHVERLVEALNEG